MDFESYTEYKTHAVKLTKFFVPGRTLRKKLLRSSEYVGEAISIIMKADWKYDPLQGTKLTTFRCTYFKNFIRTYLKKIAKPKNNGVGIVELNKHAVHDNSQRNLEVADIVSFLDKKERDIIEKYYFENMTLLQISKAHNISKERVRQIRNRSIEKMQELCGLN